MGFYFILICVKTIVIFLNVSTEASLGVGNDSTASSDSHDVSFPYEDDNPMDGDYSSYDFPQDSPSGKKLTRDQMRKCARNAGKGYFTRTGKFVPDKEFKYEECLCRYDCRSFDEKSRREIFEAYLNLNNWEAQSCYIISCV